MGVTTRPLGRVDEHASALRGARSKRVSRSRPRPVGCGRQATRRGRGVSSHPVRPGSVPSRDDRVVDARIVSSPIPALANGVVADRRPCFVVGSLRRGLSSVVALDRPIERDVAFPSHPSSEGILEDTASTGSTSQAIDFTKQCTVNRHRDFGLGTHIRPSIRRIVGRSTWIWQSWSGSAVRALERHREASRLPSERAASSYWHAHARATFGSAAVALVVGVVHRSRLPRLARHPQPSPQPVSMTELAPALNASSTAWQFASLPPLPA